MFLYKMVQASEPFENRTKSTIWKPDMSGFRIPLYTEDLNGQNPDSTECQAISSQIFKPWSEYQTDIQAIKLALTALYNIKNTI